MFCGLLESGDMITGFFADLSVPFLELSDKLLIPAGHPRELIVHDFPPVPYGLSAPLLPLSLDSIPVHGLAPLSLSVLVLKEECYRPKG